MDRTTLEKPQLTLGFIPLTDCAPLVIGHEKGFFEKYGLRVSLSKETSWANVRDKLADYEAEMRAANADPEDNTLWAKKTVTPMSPAR